MSNAIHLRAFTRGWRLQTLITQLSASTACLILVIAPAAAADLDFPVTPGVKIVLAVHNAGSPSDQKPSVHVAQGDYEAIVTLDSVDNQAIDQTAFIDADDESSTRRQVSIPRRVLTTDLDRARMQVLGFLDADEPILPGTTALGPSLLIMRELQESCSSAYSFHNFSTRDAASGTLKPSSLRRIVNSAQHKYATPAGRACSMDWKTIAMRRVARCSTCG